MWLKSEMINEMNFKQRKLPTDALTPSIFLHYKFS
jgi:hypothetical protein